MIYTANQPLIFPHIYMLNRYATVDSYVSMDEAQFTKFGHQSRVELLDKHGNEVKLIINLRDRAFKSIDELYLLNVDDTIRTTKNMLQVLYGKAPFYKSHIESLHYAFYQIQQRAKTIEYTLAEFNHHLLLWLFKELRMTLDVHHSKDLVPVRPEHPSEWVCSLGKALNATQYVGGLVAKNAYVQDEDFAQAGIAYISQDFKLEPYARGRNSVNSRATVSTLDALFYIGVQGVKELIL